MVRASLLMLLFLAGHGWAGEAAWEGRYRIRDAVGERELVLLRGDDRIEYRIAGEPVRVWRKVADGIELSELYPQQRRKVVFSPGDLRTLDKEPDWALLGDLIDPALRAQLQAAGGGRGFDQAQTRYRGHDAQGRPVELDWLDAAALPARYCVGRPKAKRCDADAIRLQGLRQVDAAAFSPADELLEIDQADLGDMELDPFVKGLGHAGH